MYLISDGGMICNILDTVDAIMLTINNKKIDGIKIDVRKTLDNVYVLSKYNELNKLTYANHKVNECNYNYLKKVKFKSHIFKYHIPTLEEILIKYDNNKIMVLEIYDNNLDDLFNLISKYSYKYYFLSKDRNIINELKELGFNKLGIIIDNYNNLLPSKMNNKMYCNTFLIK